MCTPFNALWYSKALYLLLRMLCLVIWGQSLVRSGPVFFRPRASISSLRAAHGSCWLQAWNNLFCHGNSSAAIDLIFFFFIYFFKCKPHIIILKFVCFGDLDFTSLVKNLILAFICKQWSRVYTACMEDRSRLFLEQYDPGLCCMLCWMPCTYYRALDTPVCAQQPWRSSLCLLSLVCTVEVEVQFISMGRWKAEELQMHHISH